MVAHRRSTARYCPAPRVGERVRVGRSVFSRMQSSQRASWWITFVLLAALGGAWALASPSTGAPDEGDHVVNANAVARGELVGDPLSAHQRAALGPSSGQRSAYRSVDVPELYGTMTTGCFAFKPDATADCLSIAGPTRNGPVVTPVARYPPAYYAFVGLVARPFVPGGLALHMMRFASVALMAALLASAVASLRRAESARFRLVGLLASVTPMVLFINASVNPNGPEIAAALALWVSGAVLVRELEQGAEIDGRLVLRIGIAATILAVARQDSPLWLGLIVVTLGLLAGWRHVRSMWRSRGLRIWGTVVVLCTVAQLAWVIGVGTLAADHSVFFPLDVAGSAAARTSIGNTFWWYHQMIGYFGWLDTPSPELTVFLWTLVIGGLVVLALGLGARRWVLATLAVLGVTIALPIVLECAQSQGYGTGHWQGRYALTFAVGAPILAVLALEQDELIARLSASIMPGAIAVALGVAQVTAFAQNLRRYTVGAHGRVWFFLDPKWSPPFGAGVLFAGFVVVLAATYIWLLTAGALRPVPAIDTPEPAPAESATVN